MFEKLLIEGRKRALRQPAVPDQGPAAPKSADNREQESQGGPGLAAIKGRDRVARLVRARSDGEAVPVFGGDAGPERCEATDCGCDIGRCGVAGNFCRPVAEGGADEHAMRDGLGSDRGHGAREPCLTYPHIHNRPIA